MEKSIFAKSVPELSDIRNWFGEESKPLTPLQKQALSQIKFQALGLAETILGHLPRCPDRTAAIRKVREAVETALMGIRSERNAYVERETE
jgi:hypothetical protein